MTELPDTAPCTAHWPEPGDFVQGPVLPHPAQWDRPGLAMFFNLECPSCVSRGLPFLKRLLWWGS